MARSDRPSGCRWPAIRRVALHDVLIADGAPAESYRDDGNRQLFQNVSRGWKHSLKEPCARALTSGPIVDLIWRRLRDRANAQPPLPMTREPDVHLVVDGKRIDAIDRSDARYVFQISPGPRSVRIRSRCAAPQTLGVSRDARVLGVAVQRIVVAHGRRQRVVTADSASLTKGYHAFEADFGIRWTDGDGAVPAALFAGMNTPGLLMLHLGAPARYSDHAVSPPGVEQCQMSPTKRPPQRTGAANVRWVGAARFSDAPPLRP